MNDTTENSRISKEAKDAVLDLVSCVKHLVNNPDDVEIDISEQGYTLIISLKTNPEDVGQVIGKSAYLIISIRSLLTAIASKNRIKAILQYVTEEDNKRKAEDSPGNYQARDRDSYRRRVG